MWGERDGEGWSLVQYWKMPAKVVAQLDNPTLPWAIVLKRFLDAPCKDVDNETKMIHQRLKLICRVANQEEVELGSFEKGLIQQYNAKPVLTRPQHAFFKGKTDGGVPYFEAVLDAHDFNLIARKGLNSLLDRIKDMVLDISFCMEGHSNDELPETLLGCYRLNRVDMSVAAQPLPDAE